MRDDDPNKPLMPEGDSESYELAEDPDDKPASSVPLPVGVSLPGRPASVPELKDEPTPTVKKATKGPESHFSGDEPAYVNAEVQRMRREELRIKAAEEEAELSAKRTKVMLIVAGGSTVVVMLVFWLLLR